VFPELGRSTIREALRGLPGASENLGFAGCQLLSPAAGWCLPAEMTEQPACVIQRQVKQFSLNSPSLAV